MSFEPPITIDADAVLLDMDGTLVDSSAVVNRVWTQWAIKHQLTPADVLAICHGRQGHETMADLLPDRSREVNLTENAELLAQEVADVDGVVAIPGAPEFLAALKNIPHALVTSADLALATTRMTACGMAMPEVSITAEQVAKSKPDPEGFLAAAAALGVPPARCVVFEDSAAGIAAAHSAGMKVVGVGHAAKSLNTGANLDDFAQVTVRASNDPKATISWGHDG